jgi:hypothetical protein
MPQSPRTEPKEKLSGAESLYRSCALKDRLAEVLDLRPYADYLILYSAFFLRDPANSGNTTSRLRNCDGLTSTRDACQLRNQFPSQKLEIPDAYVAAAPTGSAVELAVERFWLAER